MDCVLFYGDCHNETVELETILKNGESKLDTSEIRDYFLN